MFIFARNETNPKKRQYHLQSLEVLLRDLDKAEDHGFLNELS
jgi:hypothetical protein